MKKVGGAIPNEVSKLNSWNKYNPEPFSRAAIGSVAGLDRFATTYGKTGEFQPALSHSMSAFMGSSADPDLYSPKNQRFASDPWMTIGNVGNLLPGPGGEMDMGQIQNFLQMDDVNKRTGGIGRSAASLIGASRLMPNITMPRMNSGVGYYR